MIYVVLKNLMDFDAYAPIVMAILCGIILISILSKPKPRFPVMPRPFAVFDEHGILWNRDAVGKPQTRTLRYPNASTSYELMQAACKAGGSELTAGKRRLKKRHWVEHQGRQVEKLEFEDHYDFWTFTELAELMGAVGSGLASVTKFKNNDSIIIYAETAREWFLAAQGA